MLKRIPIRAVKAGLLLLQQFKNSRLGIHRSGSF